MMVGQPGSPEQGFELLDQLDYHHYLGKMLIMKRDLELHQGEGGDDAALLVADFARAYERFFVRRG